MRLQTFYSSFIYFCSFFSSFSFIRSYRASTSLQLSNILVYLSKKLVLLREKTENLSTLQVFVLGSRRDLLCHNCSGSGHSFLLHLLLFLLLLRSRTNRKSRESICCSGNS